MKPEQFAYWLQGFCEINQNIPPNQEQWDVIVEHLQTLFKKETKGFTTPTREFTPAISLQPFNVPDPLRLVPATMPEYTGQTITC